MSTQAERAAGALRRFEDALRSVRAPLLHHLAPGLDPDAVAEAVAPLGLRLPEGVGADGAIRRPGCRGLDGALVERGIWRVVGAGDLVTVQA